MQTGASEEKAVRLLDPGDMFGDYTVEKLLGKGGMGAVYLVRAPGGERYAVKVMFPEMVKKGSDYRKRFAREAEFAMNIRHKNLISVYDVGEDPETGFCYIIMDYMPGGSVADRLEQGGPLPMAEAVSIAAQVALALEVAHRHGVIHRDIKPENIMFDADGTPKLADLGVAKFTDEAHKTTVTTTGMIIGTPAYMAPEQMMDSHHVDARADIYALGVVLYEMLTGKRPNEGSTAVELLAKAIKGEPLPDVRTMRPEISAAVAHVLSLMCAPKPEARPATALEAAHLLQKAATGRLALPKKPPRAADAAARKKRRNMVVAAVGVVGLVSLIAMIIVASSARFTQRARPVPAQSLVTTNVDEGPVSAAAAAPDRKSVEIFPRLDRSPKAWAYSFEKEQGWETPDFDDSGWKRAQGGFGSRQYQTEIRDGRFNVLWNTDTLFVRRHFKWEGGEVSRVVLELFCDDGATFYLNGQTVFCHDITGCWRPLEISPACFNQALKKGDNLFSVEVKNTGGPCYFDCGLIVECGGKTPEYYPVDHTKQIKTDVGTWTVKIENGIAQLGDGSNRALSPEPIEELVLPSELGGFKIRKVAPNSFKDCKALKKVKIPEGVFSIGYFAFGCCHALEDVSLPESLGHIDAKAFFETKIKRIDFKNVRLLLDETLDRCALEEFKVNPDNPVYYVDGGVLYDRVRRAVVKCPCSRTEYVFPKGIEEVYSEAFQYCGLKSLVLPETLLRAGDAMCSESRRLESVEFRSEDAIMGSVAFANCASLKQVVLPRSLKWLDDWSIFANCTALEHIRIPDTVTRISDAVFEGCVGLTRVEVGGSVEFIGPRVFQNCRNLETITLPASLKNMRDRVFLNCTSLKVVRFQGDKPDVGERLYEGTGANLVTCVRKGASGWTNASGGLPEMWPVGDPDARPIRNFEGSGGQTAANVSVGPQTAKARRHVPDAGDKAFANCDKKTEVSLPEGPVKPYVSKSKLHAAYRSKDRERVFVEVCHQHTHDSFKTPPYTLDRVREAIDLKADILFFTLARSKDGVLFSAERENIEHVSTGTGSFGDYTASQVKRMNVKHWGQVTAKHFATLEDMIRMGKGKILFKVGGFRECRKELDHLLDRLDAWECVMVESHEVPADKQGCPPRMWGNILSGKLQVTALGVQSFADWKKVTAECTAEGGNDDLSARGMLNIPERVFGSFVYGPGDGDRTDDEAGWEKALKEGVTVFRTNRPRELVKYLKKKRRR